MGSGITLRGVSTGLILFTAMLLLSVPAHAAIESRSILKTYFQTGDVPTQQQFGNLLDSMVNFTDDRDLLGLRVYNPGATYLPGDTVVAKRFGIGDTAPLSPAEYVNPDGLVLNMATDFAGQYGFLEMLLGDTLGGRYYGYIQLGMDLPGGPIPPGPGIHVDFIVYESTANTGITTALVPEPACLSILALAGLLTTRRRTGRA